MKIPQPLQDSQRSSGAFATRNHCGSPYATVAVTIRNGRTKNPQLLRTTSERPVRVTSESDYPHSPNAGRSMNTTRSAECANCSQPITTYGRGWHHVDTGLERCAMEFWAIPVCNRQDLPLARRGEEEQDQPHPPSDSFARRRGRHEKLGRDLRASGGQVRDESAGHIRDTPGDSVGTTLGHGWPMRADVLADIVSGFVS